MVVWSPWWADSGPYWMLYNREAPETANLVGVFAGRGSRALGAVSSGTGVYTLPGAAGARTLTLPGQWQASDLLKREGNGWTLTYAGGEPLTITLKKR